MSTPSGSRGMYWRSSETSARLNSAYSSPDQSRHGACRVASSGVLSIARRLKRSPQAGGGVASSRIRWRWPGLRSTACTSVSASIGAPRSSSVQRSVPPRSTSSVCASAQSAKSVPSRPVVGDRSSPATSSRPSVRRRMSSSAPSITSCSKPSRQAERGDSAATTLGRRRAMRPSWSNKVMSRNSKEGIRPCERMRSSPMRTGTPSARLACASRPGRKSLIRGTIQPCSRPQLRPTSSQKATTSQSSPRATRAARRARRGSRGGRGGTASISSGIMTVAAGGPPT